MQKLEEGGEGGSEAERIIVFCSVHHEAEEGGEAVQGGVEELSTGLPASATVCLYVSSVHLCSRCTLETDRCTGLSQRSWLLCESVHIYYISFKKDDDHAALLGRTC